MPLGTAANLLVSLSTSVSVSVNALEQMMEKRQSRNGHPERWRLRGLQIQDRNSAQFGLDKIVNTTITKNFE